MAFTIGLVGIIFYPFIFHTSFRHDGTTINSRRAERTTRRFLNAISRGDFEAAASVVNFLGFTETVRRPNAGSISDERERFIRGLTEFFSGDVRFSSYRNVRFRTNDFFAQGEATIELVSSTGIYELRLYIVAAPRGKIAIGATSPLDRTNEQATQLADELTRIISTYFPG